MSSKKKRPPKRPSDAGVATSEGEIHHAHPLGSALEAAEGSPASAEFEPDDEHDAKSEEP
jgi:hypothetical protein